MAGGNEKIKNHVDSLLLNQKASELQSRSHDKVITADHLLLFKSAGSDATMHGSDGIAVPAPKP